MAEDGRHSLSGMSTAWPVLRMNSLIKSTSLLTAECFVVSLACMQEGAASRVGIQGARARVLDQLRDGIIRGEYQPGASLSEVTLAETYGTSRTPIREAIQQLASEGLVEVVPRVGTFVREPSRRE